MVIGWHRGPVYHTKKFFYRSGNDLAELSTVRRSNWRSSCFSLPPQELDPNTPTWLGDVTARTGSFAKSSSLLPGTQTYTRRLV